MRCDVACLLCLPHLRCDVACSLCLPIVNGCCSSVSFRDQPSFPISANTTVHLKCQDHLVDLVSQSGHLQLPTGAVLMVDQCHVLAYSDFTESKASEERGPDFGPASFLGNAPNAAFHAFNSTVQYAHVVRSSILLERVSPGPSE